MDTIKFLQECANQIGIDLTDKQLAQFQTYYEMLVETNKVMNLTAITQKDEVIIKHFLDSIAVIAYMDLNHKKVLDVGTGAGFPGIPIKIVCPDAEVVLLDSLNKRVNFLNEVTTALELDGITAIHGRAEDMAREKAHRGQYDVVVSRAVANLATLSEYDIPFLKISGCFISYKSGNIDDEVKDSKNAIFLCGGKLNRVEKFTLKTTDMERSFVFIDKVKNTPKMYPRKSGTPAKQPL